MRPILCLAIGWLTLFVLGTDLFVISPLLPPIAADYRVSPADAAWTMTLFSLAYMVGAPLFGQIADRVGRRRTVTWGLVAFAVTNALTGAAPGFPALLAVRFAAGLAAASISPSLYAMIGGAAPPERRATWLAVALSGLLVALSTGAPLGALIGAAYGWSAVFWILTGLSVLAVVANRLAWPADRGGGGAAATPGPGAGVLAARLLVTVVWSTALYGVYTYLGAGLTEQGFSTAAIAAILFCYGIGAFAGTMIGGRVADRFGTRATVLVSLLGLAASFLALSFLFRPGVQLEAAVAVLLAIASALAQMLFPAQQSSLATEFAERRSTALAWNNSALYFGISLSAATGGAIFTQGGFVSDLYTGAVLAVVAAVLALRIIPGRAKERLDRP